MDIKEKDGKEKKNHMLSAPYSMITVYLKVNIGVLLALGINCCRRESESGEGFSQGCEPAEQLCEGWEQSIYGWSSAGLQWREA